MNWTKFLTADKDRSVFFTSVTILASAVAVVAVSNEHYIVTAMAAGAAVVGLVGLLAKAVTEIAAPMIDTAILSMTGRFKRFEGSAHNGTYNQ